MSTRQLTDSLGRQQQAKFIDEGNLYRLIVSSKLPSAEKFERWVFEEVLPTVRKTGTYAVPHNHVQQTLAEAKLNNSRARTANAWLRLADKVSIPEYGKVCASYASEALVGHEIIPNKQQKGLV